MDGVILDIEVLNDRRPQHFAHNEKVIGLGHAAIRTLTIPPRGAVAVDEVAGRARDGDVGACHGDHVESGGGGVGELEESRPGEGDVGVGEELGEEDGVVAGDGDGLEGYGGAAGDGGGDVREGCYGCAARGGGGRGGFGGG